MSDKSPINAFFGWLLMALGGLIALTCGLCTLGFTGIGLVGAWDQHSDQDWLGFALLALAIGVPLTALGVGLVVVGRRLARKRSPGVAR